MTVSFSRNRTFQCPAIAALFLDIVKVTSLFPAPPELLSPYGTGRGKNNHANGEMFGLRVFMGFWDKFQPSLILSSALNSNTKMLI